MRLGILAVAALLGTAAGAHGAACTAADYVLKAQRIYTANDAQWTAERVAVKGDRIVFVGSAAAAKATLCAPEAVAAGFVAEALPLEDLLAGAQARAEALAPLGANRELFGSSKERIFGESPSINRADGAAHLLRSRTA